MIRSMTAFSRAERNGDFGQLAWEIRSVNHRYLEIAVRMPEELRNLEMRIRERARKRLGRGKVDLNLRFRPTGQDAGCVHLNEQHTRRLLAICDRIGSLMETNQPISPADVMGWPGVLREQEPDADQLAHETLRCLDEALDSLIEGRENEGARLRDMIETRLDAMQPLVDQVRKNMPQVLTGIRERLQKRLAESRTELDPDRLEQEMVLLAQRLDVDEEMDRLQSHMQEMRDILDRKEPVGRRMDFLMQEFNREANTLGSKSSDTQITRAAVELKVLIEQMREQVQNIE